MAQISSTQAKIFEKIGFPADLVEAAVAQGFSTLEEMSKYIEREYCAPGSVENLSLAPDTRKFLSTFKVVKCKDNSYHDRKLCSYWHSKLDRRRNPFEKNYSSYKCSENSDSHPCSQGDDCQYFHNTLERMYHPDLYKISICDNIIRNGTCDHGKHCAFAHSVSELRRPTRSSLKKQDSNITNKVVTKSVESDESSGVDEKMKTDIQINEQEKSLLSLKPIESSNSLAIKFSPTKDEEEAIFNLDSTRFPLSDLSNGTYDTTNVSMPMLASEDHSNLMTFSYPVAPITPVLDNTLGFQDDSRFFDNGSTSFGSFPLLSGQDPLFSESIKYLDSHDFDFNKIMDWGNENPIENLMPFDSFFPSKSGVHDHPDLPLHSFELFDKNADILPNIGSDMESRLIGNVIGFGGHSPQPIASSNVASVSTSSSAVVSSVSNNNSLNANNNLGITSTLNSGINSRLSKISSANIDNGKPGELQVVCDMLRRELAIKNNELSFQFREMEKIREKMSTLSQLNQYLEEQLALKSKPASEYFALVESMQGEIRKRDEYLHVLGQQLDRSIDILSPMLSMDASKNPGLKDSLDIQKKMMESIPKSHGRL